MLGGRGVLDHRSAQHVDRRTGATDIGKRCHGAQLVAPLTDILVHPRGRCAARLDQRERLAGVDRRQLLTIADQRELFDAERIDDLVQLEEIRARHHRGLINDEQRARQRRARLLVARTRALDQETLMGVDERGDRPALDARAIA